MLDKKYSEPQAINSVAQFHDTFGLPIEQDPLIPDMKRAELRINLLEEELQELKDAIKANDLVEVADALCDLQYVLSGAILEFGLGDKFKSLFDEVQRSNMSKTCRNKEVALATQKHYLDKDGTTSEVMTKDDCLIVYRKSDGKVLKSVEYSPANLKTLM